MPPELSGTSGRSAGGAFVGRDAELTRMLTAGRDALAGRPAAILVEGPPGIGKSALLREFALHSPQFRTIDLAAFPDEADMTYGLISQLALTLKAWGHDPDWARISADGDPVAVGMTVLESLSAAAAESPVLLLVDDVPSADAESALVLRFLLRRLGSDRLLVALTADKWSADVLPADAVTDTITLGGLDRSEIAALVQGRLGRPDDDLVGRLAGWTGGNPAMLSALLSDEALSDESLMSGRSDEPPASMESALRVALRRLPAESRAVLGALSVLSAPAPVTDLAAVAEVSGRLPELVDRLVAAHLVRRPTPESVEFVSSALRTATERTLDAATRRGLHTTAAAVVPAREEQLRHLVAAREGPDPALARILDGEAESEADAGDLLRAARYAAWAAEADPGDPDHAVRLTTAVRLFVRVGHDASALDLAARVDALAPSADREEAQGLLAFARGEPATALTLLLRAEAAAARQPPRGRARIAIEVATVATVLFAGELAVEASERARALTDEPDVDRLARATGAFGRALLDGPAAALAELDHLPAQPAECAEHDLTALTFRGIFRGLVGRFDEAIADLTVAARRREATRRAVFGVTAHIHLASCQLTVGLWEVALQTLDVGTELAPVYGRAYDHAALRSSGAIVRAVRGDLIGARRELAASTRLSAHSDFLGPSFHQTLARAAIAWSEGTHGEVIALLEPWLHQRNDRNRVELFGLWWLPMLADAQVTTGRGREARASIDRLAGLDAVPGSMRDTAVAWLSGRLARRQGDIKGSLRILSAAVDGPDFALRPNLYSGMTLLVLGNAQHDAGDHQAARRTFRSAITTLEAMGAAPLAARCRDRVAALYPAPSRPGPLAVLDRLTEKEGQVAALVGRGWTNPEIARTLFVSTKTVEYHLRNIFIKLDLQGRRQLRDLLQTPAA